MARTPAIAALERAGVAFRLHEYTHDAGAESYALEAADKLGVDPARLFKTLVVAVDGALAVVLVPAEAQLALKTIGKRAQLVDKRHAERVTGYVSGGISPLGQRRVLPTHIDASALEHETVLVSAGQRGLQLELDPRELVRLTDANVHPIVH